MLHLPNRTVNNLYQEKALEMTIDKDTVTKVAKLARIGLNPEELDNLSKELSSILKFIDQLNEVDIENVKPMTSLTSLKATLRDDIITEGGNPEAVLKNAPNSREGFFAVPKVIE